MSVKQSTVVACYWELWCIEFCLQWSFHYSSQKLLLWNHAGYIDSVSLLILSSYIRNIIIMRQYCKYDGPKYANS